MTDQYGIFTTDGETVAGRLHDEYAIGLAERLDESTASLYISTKNSVLLLGTAVNVQKTGRRPDTFIYLEKTSYNKELPPRIDLHYIHEFYGRVRTRLSDIGYEVRDLASDGDFFDERNRRKVTGLLSPDAVDYSLGRILLGKEVVCVSDNLSKSVDFVVATAEKLLSYISAGFTIVVAKRTFRDADILVTERYPGRVHVDLNTERADDQKWGDIYKEAGLTAQNPSVRPRYKNSSSRADLAGWLISEYKRSRYFTAGKKSRLSEFLESENIGASEGRKKTFSPSAYDMPQKDAGKGPDESGYGRWKINDYDRENLKLEYQEHMEKKNRAKTRFIAVLGIFLVLLAAVIVLFALSPGFISPAENTTGVVHITPSATIIPDEGIIIEKLNTTPGNLPDGMEGVGSAYKITVSGPQNATLTQSLPYSVDKIYYLMKYNLTGYSWGYAGSVLSVSNDSATVSVPDSGIYRLFTKRAGAD